MNLNLHLRNGATLLLGSILSSGAFAQNQPVVDYVRCSTVEMEAELSKKHPKRLNQEQFEQWIKPFVEEEKAKSNLNAETLITIPVVVHVIHNGEAVGVAPNITDAQAISQITVMNQDFRRIADTPGFNNHADGADIQVEFCLATVDPEGNPTTGVNHVNMNQNSWDRTSIEGNLKPNTIWDPTQYMNMWSVKFSNSSLLGYAQFPSNSGLGGFDDDEGGADTDGVVAAYSTFGSINLDDGTFILNAPYNEGRTMTHEVGHWIGLRHIWGDGGCSVDDYCDDTPRAGGSNYGCDTTNSCDDTQYGLATNPNDMIENYMDYTDDSCMNIFTNDQKARIRAVMLNSPRRKELVNSPGCQPAEAKELDASVSVSTENLSCASSITPSVKVINKGTSTLTSAKLEIKHNNVLVQTINWSGSLATDAEIAVNVNAFSIETSGAQSIEVTVSEPNGGVDEFTNNDTKSTSFDAGVIVETASITVEIKTDLLGAETSWSVTDGNGVVVASVDANTYDDGIVYTQNVPVDAGKCYTFTIMDAGGNGIASAFLKGYYNVFDAEGNTLTSGASFTDEESFKFLNKAPLSINNQELSKQVSIFPNPASNVIYINSVNFGQRTAYDIFNLSGQKILSGNLMGTNAQVNTSTLQKGIYILKLNVNGKYVTRKISIK